MLKHHLFSTNYKKKLITSSHLLLVTRHSAMFIFLYFLFTARYLNDLNFPYAVDDSKFISYIYTYLT